MPEVELKIRLVQEKDFTDLENELQTSEILYLSHDLAYFWQNARFRALIFFSGDETRIVEMLKFLGIKSFKHPSMKQITFSHKEIYNRMFKDVVGKILDDIEKPESIFHQNHSRIKREITFLSNNIDKVVKQLGEEFLDVSDSSYNMTLKEIVDKMNKFAKKTPFR